MKRTSLYLLATLIVALCSVPQTTAAQSCNSAASVTADLWNELHDLAAELDCSLSASSPSQRATRLIRACGSEPQQVAHLSQSITEFWNDQANGAWATLGPRRLRMNQNHVGRLVSTGGRMFVAAEPMTQRRVTLTIDELDGKAKTSIVICKVDEHNQRTKVRTVWFNETRAQKKDKSQRRVVQVRGAKNHLITVHLDAKSATNTFRYRLRAE
jgi:hypothetical protein